MGVNGTLISFDRDFNTLSSPVHTLEAISPRLKIE